MEHKARRIIRVLIAAILVTALIRIALPGDDFLGTGSSERAFVGRWITQDMLFNGVSNMRHVAMFYFSNDGTLVMSSIPAGHMEERFTWTVNDGLLVLDDGDVITTYTYEMVGAQLIMTIANADVAGALTFVLHRSGIVSSSSVVGRWALEEGFPPDLPVAFRPVIEFHFLSDGELIIITGRDIERLTWTQANGVLTLAGAWSTIENTYEISRSGLRIVPTDPQGATTLVLRRIE